MTGRDLILYILKNHLEDKPVFENGSFIGFISPEEAAEKFNVGVSTINAWILLNTLPAVTTTHRTFISATANDPRKE